MKHIFLDTNIIIDIFAARAPYDIAAIELYRLAKDNKIKIYDYVSTLNIKVRLELNVPMEIRVLAPSDTT